MHCTTACCGGGSCSCAWWLCQHGREIMLLVGTCRCRYQVEQRIHTHTHTHTDTQTHRHTRTQTHTHTHTHTHTCTWSISIRNDVACSLHHMVRVWVPSTKEVPNLRMSVRRVSPIPSVVAAPCVQSVKAPVWNSHSMMLSNATTSLQALVFWDECPSTCPNKHMWEMIKSR